MMNAPHPMVFVPSLFTKVVNTIKVKKAPFGTREHPRPNLVSNALMKNIGIGTVRESMSFGCKGMAHASIQVAMARSVGDGGFEMVR